MQHDQPDYGWLVEKRSQVQHVLFRLYKLVESDQKLELLANNPTWRSAFGLLTGAGFSLWRAAFLSDAEVTWPENIKHAKKFLEHVIGDNIINYNQDRATRNWSSGYYLNNACFRLVRTYKVLALDDRNKQTAAHKRLIELDQKGLTSKPRQESWNTLYDSLTELFKRLQQTIRSNGRVSGIKRKRS